MPADMKLMIAQSTMELLTEQKIKKLTVKDIVEKCNITRQTFYYHFEDIPDLFRWMISEYTKMMIKELSAKGDAQERLKSFFVMVVNALPYAKSVRDSNYGEESEQILRRYIKQFLAEVSEKNEYLRNRSAAEVKIILRYHSLAVFGLLNEWTDDDTEHLDEIVHTVYRMITEGVPLPDQK